jgi:hypothetical protein
MDHLLRHLIRQYAQGPTDDLAHRLANEIVRAGGLPGEELKRFGFFSICSDCAEPHSTFEICSYLGYNPGIDGHLYKTQKEAERDWGYFTNALSSDRAQGIVRGDYWTDLPFSSLEEELEYLKTKVKLVEFYIIEN